MVEHGGLARWLELCGYGAGTLALGSDGRATLHTFGSALLEGGWTEEGAKGMWRIWLR